MVSKIPRNEIFEKYGLPPDLKIGSNKAGSKPASAERPVHYGEWDVASNSGYVVGDNMINEPPPGKPFKIAFIGAGAAGIDFLHHAPSVLQGLGVEIVCYDKNENVGGTWYENRYPGCACDVPSVSYAFPWRPNPCWTSFYSSAQEIWQYMRDIVDEEGMMKYIQLRTEIISATWDEDHSKWHLKVRRTAPETNEAPIEWEDSCDLLLNGGGSLNAWKWPNIRGLETFQGDMFHTAHYKEGFDLKGKSVAVIGAGSSGVQTVASIYPDVSRLFTWVRSQTWITASIGQKFAGPEGQNFEYTQSQKTEFLSNPEKYQRYRKTIEHDLNSRFKSVLRNSAESNEANAFAYVEMTRKLKSRPEILDFMIPDDFNVGCRRPTPDHGYLQALAGEKTTVLPGSISAITPAGVVDAAGIEHPVDVIICATGFDTSFRPRFPIVGLDQTTTLADKWTHLPASYLGISVDGFPNYFTYGGPFTPVAQGSVLPILSHLSRHFLEIVTTMRRQHIRRLSPKGSCVNDFMEHTKTYLPRTCWADPCTSWFKQGTKDGDLIMWPGSRLSFFEAVRSPHLQDYEIEYWSRNRFGYLGNGFVDFEFTSPKDNTWYLDEYSGVKEWRRDGVPYNPDTDEFVHLGKVENV